MSFPPFSLSPVGAPLAPSLLEMMGAPPGPPRGEVRMGGGDWESLGWVLGIWGSLGSTCGAQKVFRGGWGILEELRALWGAQGEVGIRGSGRVEAFCGEV